ncbi:MAG TPA: TetR/AcrR family transcriptional regulator [Pseudomonadales bacterium]|nr:TetR/AcrR family transcriptional regulator [Pseudomonadales bacterium]
MGNPEKRTPYHHGDLRSALLDAGEAVLAERGAAGFTLRECARRAGVSHAAPAHHFGDVSGLLSEIGARGFERLVAAVRHERSAASAEDLDAQMIATVRAYVNFARAEPQMFRVMFRCDLLDPTNPVLLAAAKETFAELTSAILQQRGEAAIGADELDAALGMERLIEDILVGWCHIHGLAHLLIEGQLDPMKGGDEDAFLARVIRDNGPRLSRVLRT